MSRPADTPEVVATITTLRLAVDQMVATLQAGLATSERHQWLHGCYERQLENCRADPAIQAAVMVAALWMLAEPARGGNLAGGAA